MAAGDFLEVYRSDEYVDSFDCVVTSFFIDCAHNVVDFVELIHKILKPGDDFRLDLLLARSTKERTRHPFPQIWKRLSIVKRARILQLQFYNCNFTNANLQGQFYNCKFTRTILQALLAQPQSKCLLLFQRRFGGFISIFEKQFHSS
jgi:hypothetical protein